MRIRQLYPVAHRWAAVKMRVRERGTTVRRMAELLLALPGNGAIISAHQPENEMATYRVTLKRVIYADVFVQASSAAEAKRQFDEEDSRWESFNTAESFHGEDTKIHSVKPEVQRAYS
jgi:hypothetical protein